MWANHPEIARKWTEKYGAGIKPKKIKPSKKKKKLTAAGRRFMKAL